MFEYFSKLSIAGKSFDTAGARFRIRQIIEAWVATVERPGFTPEVLTDSDVHCPTFGRV